jgi:hypothetical protein
MTSDDADAAIDAAIDRVIGRSFFATPKQTCVLLGVSPSKYHRAVRAGRIQATKRGDYPGVPRPELKRLLKNGFEPIPKTRP